jgi:hypothetical protein
MKGHIMKINSYIVFVMNNMILKNMNLAKYHCRKSNRAGIVSVFLSGLLVFGLPACSERKQPVDYVNPFICTQGDHGQWMPVASVPFGMVTLGPDSYPGSLTADGNLAHGGYDYSDHQVRGFSHMHKGSSGGTEIRDRSGRISIVPFSGTPEDTSFYTNPVLDMDKASEKAEAGYYAVELTRDHIRVELTATPYAGMHRYTFPEGKDMKIFLNAGRLWEGISCTLKDEYTLEGELNGNYFVLQSEIPIRKTSVWDGQRLAGTQTVEALPGSGIICEF